MRKTTPLRIFVLAGGRSSRMGRDKARLLLGSRNFLERIIATAHELEAPVEVVTQDEVPGIGPLGGVLTAFRRTEFQRALFLSCDMPLVTAEWLRVLLSTAAGQSAFTESDRPQAGFPFVLSRAAEPVLQILLQRDQRSLQELSAALNSGTCRPHPKDRWQLANVNTPEDYAAVAQLWSERHRSDAVLEVRRLTVQRDGHRLVSEFSWQVRHGQHWVVLGPNGCGKTSLFSALLGYVTPTRGEIFVLGQEYGDADWPDLRKQIGMVSSSVRQMMPEAEPAWITVASGKYAVIDFWGTPKPRDKAEALKLLQKIECEYLADRPWAVLSQGERQRVLIARALMAKPALLILDEPCAGLDPAAREHFLQFLQRLGSKRSSPSIVLITHHVEEVMPVFSHALLMKNGSKLAEGTVDAVITSRRLSEAFNTPIQVRKTGERYGLRVSSFRNLIA